MAWWKIVLIVMFCDWSALGIMSWHLSRTAKKAVLEGVAVVKVELMNQFNVILNPLKLILARFGIKMDEEVKDASRSD